MTFAPPAVRFAGQQSYTLQEDQVCLQAELTPASATAAAPLALQLWAMRDDDQAICIKLAELPVLPHNGDAGGLIPVQGYAPLSLPAGHDTYRLSLVVVSTGAAEPVVHDRIDFPQPTVFDLPQLSGPVRIGFGNQEIRLLLPGVFNPRASGSLSGSLSVALWALSQPYQGGAFTGVQLGEHALGQVGGQSALEEQLVTWPLLLPLAGDWVLTVMLREWTSAGYLTRDFQTLPGGLPEVAEASAALPVTAGVEAAPVPVLAAAPVQEPAKAEPATLKVSVNTASMEALAAVKGVGTKLAAAIVAGRPYAVMTDLLRVRGMGEKLLARLRKVLGL